jgi:phospholipase C
VIANTGQYFGTMAGVRGFADPNVQVNPGRKTTFDQ